MYRKDTYKIKKKKMEEKKMRKTHRTKALIATTVAAAVLLTTPVWADEAKKDTKEKYKVGFVVQNQTINYFLNVIKGIEDHEEAVSYTHLVETMYAPADPASWRREHSSDLLSDRGPFSE